MVGTILPTNEYLPLSPFCFPFFFSPPFSLFSPSPHMPDFRALERAFMAHSRYACSDCFFSFNSFFPPGFLVFFLVLVSKFPIMLSTDGSPSTKAHRKLNRWLWGYLNNNRSCTLCSGLRTFFNVILESSNRDIMIVTWVKGRLGCLWYHYVLSQLISESGCAGMPIP